MEETKPEMRLNAATRRALSIHGMDTVDVLYIHFLAFLLHASFALAPLFLLGFLSIGLLFFSSWYLWVWLGSVAILAYSAILGIVGMLHLLADYRKIYLIYKDRIVVIRGHATTEIPVAEVETVFVHTSKTNDDGALYYEPGQPHRVYIEVDNPIACFWREWTELRLRDGTSHRVPSTMTGYDEFSRWIQGEIAVRHVERQLGELRSGRSVSIGPFTIHTEYLKVGSEQLPWGEHQFTSPRGGYIVTQDTSGNEIGPKIPTERVPDLAVAAILIDTATKGEL